MSKFENIIYPEAFCFPRIRIHQKCQQELKDLIDKSGKKGRFKARYKNRLDYLHKNGREAIQHPSWFEDLKHEKELYSLHLDDIDNVRILYMISEEKIYLLCAFKEKKKANAGRNSYAGNIPLALSRITDIEEET